MWTANHSRAGDFLHRLQQASEGGPRQERAEEPRDHSGPQSGPSGHESSSGAHCHRE